jgi:8-oxo-dGTP diphosphatase
MEKNRPIIVVAAIIKGEYDTYLMAKRGIKDAHGGNFEFPGGKIEFGETPEIALRREIIEELGYKISVGEHYSVENEVYGEKHIILLSYLCRIESIDDNFNNRPEIIYINSKTDLKKIDILPPDKRIIKKLFNKCIAGTCFKN